MTENLPARSLTQESSYRESAPASRPCVSVVVLAYNIAPYLEACLNSLRRQSFEDFEVLLVNDGSTDETGEIARRASLLDPRLRVVDNARNRGTFVSRCIGAERSRGNYLCLIDGDDWVAPSFLQEMVVAARQFNADVVECSAYGIHPDGRACMVSRAETSPRTATQRDILRRALDRDIWPIAWNKMFERRLYLQAAPMLRVIDEHLIVADDKLFMLPILGFARRFVHLDRALYRYRLRADSSTRLRNEASDLRHITHSSRVDAHLQDIFALLGVAEEHAARIARNRADEIMLALRIMDRYPEVDPTRRQLERQLRAGYGSSAVDALQQRRQRALGVLGWLLRRYSFPTLARMTWRSAKRMAEIRLHRSSRHTSI